MLSGQPFFPLHYWDKPKYNLQNLFPEVPEMRHANQIISACVSAEEEDVLPSASELLPTIDDALEKTSQPPARSVSVPTQSEFDSVKTLLVDDRHRIELEELVADYSNRLSQHLSSEEFGTSGPLTSKVLSTRLSRYEQLTDELMRVFAIGCYWGTDSQQSLWVRALEQIALRPGDSHGATAFRKLQYYPALLLLYSGSVAAIAAERYDTFRALAVTAQVRDRGTSEALVGRVVSNAVLEKETGQLLPEFARRKAPTSDRLFDIIEKPIQETPISKRQYERAFDRCEILLALVRLDLLKRPGSIGRFVWKHQVIDDVESEAELAGSVWAPLQAGLFDGSMDKFTSVCSQYRAWLGEHPDFYD